MAAKETIGLTISEAAEQSGLSEDTLRYYERVGLTGDIGRASSGHRRYGERDLLWLHFITRMRATGMSIETLQRYAELTREGDATRSARKELLLEHARNVESHVEEMQHALEAMHRKLQRLGDGISGSSDAPYC